MENIQENFFSKNNISLLNNNLLETLNTKNLNEKQRIYIAQTIVNNMKIIWKTIDINKIKPENLQSVLKQFNSIVYKNSFEEIKKITTKENNFTDSNQKKYERDFKSNPNNGVTIHERPESIMKKNNSWLGPNEHYVINSQERHKLANQPDRNLDNLFRPIVDIDKVSEEAQFNNYTVGKGTDFKEKLQDIQRIRDTEVPKSRKAESDLPDFLKTKSTSVKTQKDF